MPESKLDAFISRKKAYKRLLAYNRTQWYLATAQTSELGVWKGAGGLSKAWTRGSLKDTARFVSHALRSDITLLKHRSRGAIPGIIKKSLAVIQKEKYLLPIAFKSGTGTNGRKGLKKMKGDIDDGCMRSVALAVSGKKKIKLYFGRPKHN